MKRNNKLLKVFGLADEKYVEEADPTKETQKSKSPLIKKFVLAACLCLIMTACSAILFTPYDTTPPDVSKYSDSEYYLLIQKLNVLTYKKPKYQNNFDYITSAIADIFLAKDAYDNSAAPEASGDSDGGNNYQEITDNQVHGVIEGDRIKRSDKFVFYLSEYQLKSFGINEGKLDVLDTYTIVADNRFMIDCMEFYLSADCRTITLIIPYYHTDGTSTKIISISVDENGMLTTKRAITVAGFCKTSRLIDGKLIFISVYSPSNSINFSDPTAFIPTITDANGKNECISATDIYIPERVDKSAYTVIYKIDEDTLKIEDQKAIFSYANELYVTAENIYVTRSYLDRTEDEHYRFDKRMTDIVCVSITNGFEFKGEITIEGFLNNRYSIDEYNGILRVVTTTNVTRYEKHYYGDKLVFGQLPSDETWGTSANLYCINLDSWEVVAGVYQFAPIGETVRSVRYEGDKAYVCTAVQVTDPVFFFDLSDLSNITYKDTGNIEGFSTSLVNFGDGYLLGIGQGAEWGSLKIEIYRETETGVESVAVYESQHTEFSSDYKAYYIDRKNQLIGLGLEYYSTAESDFDNSYLVLHFNRESGELEVATETEMTCNQPGFMRGVYIDGYFHMFGNNDYKSVKLDFDKGV